MIGTVVKFLSPIALVLLAVVGMTACGEDHACPRGSEARNGRCRLSAEDASADSFAWPPADTSADLERPSTYPGPPPIEVDAADATEDVSAPRPDDAEAPPEDTP